MEDVFFIGKKYLFSRKFAGGEYKFYLNSDVFMKNERVYISCDTPENCFGYIDTILFSTPDNCGWYGCYTLWRHCPKWILRRIEKIFLRLMKEYCINPGFDQYVIGGNFKSINDK